MGKNYSAIIEVLLRTLTMKDNPLITILSDYLNESTSSYSSVDWVEMYHLAKKHEVSAIVFSQCKESIPWEIFKDYERSYSVTLFYYANRQNLMGKIEASLFDVEHFSIKGNSVAKFYPVPAYRTMGDTDIVIHSEDRDEVDKRLKNIGLECHSSIENREWQYHFNSMEFELHDHLVYSESINVGGQENYFNDFWKYVHNNELDWNFHFLFLMFHLRKHFMNSGVGIRHFFDIAVLCSRGPEFDWIWIETELKKLGLWGFTERVFALNDYWFRVSPPVEIDSVTEEFLHSATDLVLDNGVFGFDNEANRNNAAVNNARVQGAGKSNMLMLAISKVFPCYKVLIVVPHYSYLRNRPYLLPVVWVHRIFRSIANRRVSKNMKSVMETSFVDQETIKRREEIYSQWGL